MTKQSRSYMAIVFSTMLVLMILAVLMVGIYTVMNQNQRESFQQTLNVLTLEQVSSDRSLLKHPDNVLFTDLISAKHVIDNPFYILRVDKSIYSILFTFTTSDSGVYDVTYIISSISLAKTTKLTSLLGIKTTEPIVMMDYTQNTSYDTFITNNHASFIFYGDINHSFIIWLQQQSRDTFKIHPTDYIVTGAQRALAMNLIPYGFIKNQSLQIMFPKQFVKNDKIISIVCVPYAYISCQPTFDKRYWNLTANSKGSDVKDQLFYEAFFRFYDEIIKSYNAYPIRNKIVTEMYVDKNTGANPPIHLTVDKKLDNVTVLYARRNVYLRIKVSTKELSNVLHILPLIGDVIHIQGLNHRSLHGKFFVMKRYSNVYVLENAHSISCLFYKQDNTLLVTIDKKCIPSYAKIDDSVFSFVSDISGTIINYDNEQCVIKIINDKEILEQANKCIDNPDILTRSACESEYDGLGYLKPQKTYWDRQCMYDNDCPFFSFGAGGAYRGGCIDGVCEMPIGVVQNTNRLYSGKPICYDECANKRDWAFEGDVFDRIAFKNR